MYGSQNANKGDYVVNITVVLMALGSIWLIARTELEDLGIVVLGAAFNFYGIAGIVRKRLAFRGYVVDGAVAIVTSGVLAVLGWLVVLTWFA